MELLIISQSRGAARRVQVSAFGSMLALVAMLAGALLIADWGYARGGDDMVELFLSNPERSSQVWQREIVEQRQLLQRMRRDLGADLAALSSSVGSMQGDLNRLDAVAERVAISNSLDPKEFVFGEAAPLGGPHADGATRMQWDALLANLGALKQEIEQRETKLTVLESFLLDKQYHAAAEPVGRAVRDGWLSSAFGYRIHPVSGEREFHGGIDFAGKPGLEVHSVAAGVVTWSGVRWGYGNLVELNHGNGYLTRYAHNRENLVKVGEKVDKNQPIALLGSSGRATGPHVHFEVVHNDSTVDPWKFIRGHTD